MKHLTLLLALLLAAAVPASVVGQPQIVGDLSNGALLGQIRDTAQLQRDFASQRTLLAQANNDLGLTPTDFNEVADEIAQGRARYVEIPRRLDGMAGQHGGRAFAVHNVMIPPHTYGWEVDLERANGIVRVFMPNRCGNISYLRVARRHTVAMVPRPTQSATAAPSQLPAPTAAPEVTPAPPTVALVPVAPPSTPAPAVHHFPLLPLLAVGLIGLTFAHGAPAITIPIHHHCGCERRPR